MKIKPNEDGTIDSEIIKNLIREVLKEFGFLAPISQLEDSSEKVEAKSADAGIGVFPSVQINDDAVNFDELFSTNEEYIFLPEDWYGKEINLYSEGLVQPKKVKALIGKDVRLTFPNWNSTPNQLFDLGGCEEFGIRGCTFVCPENRPIQTGFPDKELFGWKRDSVKRGRFAYIDGQEILDKDRVTFGLSRFCYSADSEARIFLIAENIWHNGFNFSQIKNPEKGNLWLILKNVHIHNPIVEQPRSHYYSPTRFKIKIKVQAGIATIISSNSFDQILTHWGYNAGAQRSILHFDRFVFDISESQLLDNKTLSLVDRRPELERISPNSIRTNCELQVSDLTNQGIIKTKQIDESRRFNWVYELDQESSEKEIHLKNSSVPEGEFDAYIACKGSSIFAVPVNDKTKFGEDYWESGVITISNGYGWTWYNEEFSGYIENYHGSGYHRNSGGSGITQGLTIKNSSFGENAPLPTANLTEMPKEASDYLRFLRSIQK